MFNWIIHKMVPFNHFILFLGYPKDLHIKSTLQIYILLSVQENHWTLSTIMLAYIWVSMNCIVNIKCSGWSVLNYLYHLVWFPLKSNQVQATSGVRRNTRRADEAFQPCPHRSIYMIMNTEMDSLSPVFC